MEIFLKKYVNFPLISIKRLFSKVGDLNFSWIFEQLYTILLTADMF